MKWILLIVTMICSTVHASQHWWILDSDTGLCKLHEFSPQMLLEANKDARVDLYLEKAGIVSIWLPYEKKHIYFATSLDACNRAKQAAPKPSK